MALREHLELGKSPDSRPFKVFGAAQVIAVFIRPHGKYGFTLESIPDAGLLDRLRESCEDAFYGPNGTMSQILKSIGEGNELIACFRTDFSLSSEVGVIEQLFGDGIRALARVAQATFSIGPDIAFTTSLWISCLSKREWNAVKNGSLETLRVLTLEDLSRLAAIALPSRQSKSTINVAEDMRRADTDSIIARFGERAKGKHLCHYFDAMQAKKENHDWTSGLSIDQARLELDKYRVQIEASPYADAIAALVNHVDLSMGAAVFPQQEVTASEILLAKESFVSELQKTIGAASGVSGIELVELVRELVQFSTGLVFRSKKQTDVFFQLETDGKSVWLNDVTNGSLGRPIALKSPIEIEVAPIEDQLKYRLLIPSPPAVVNREALEEAELKLQPTPRFSDDRVSTTLSKKSNLSTVKSNMYVSEMMPTEFFLYFDSLVDIAPRQLLRDQFQSWLDAIPQATRTFEHYAEEEQFERKREFATEIYARAKGIGCRFVCLRSDCGLPAGFSAKQNITAPCGQFYFFHEVGKKTVNHSHTAQLPVLKLCSRRSSF